MRPTPAILYGTGKIRATARRLISQRIIGELERASTRRYISPFEIALIYVGLGETDRAFEWLERAYRERSDLLGYLNVDPRLDGMRADPRFKDLTKRVGIPLAPATTAQ